ncbi:hypothetical protein CDD80_4160 [Ophiocordyceps camponoti-rufipedis]|uniref:Uncharacterized protein n=1 Tax=Ophiocordyceps camponoti-rufipedis TaxID=2004952 RepID=A0A2C5YYX1_9HYPO|nr:hypothetical protein CDD80_4160 [Ophiocordyceps camponoti-rufipedis]
MPGRREFSHVDKIEAPSGGWLPSACNPKPSHRLPPPARAVGTNSEPLIKVLVGLSDESNRRGWRHGALAVEHGLCTASLFLDDFFGQLPALQGPGHETLGVAALPPPFSI